jgi:hypothetical protein
LFTVLRLSFREDSNVAAEILIALGKQLKTATPCLSLEICEFLLDLIQVYHESFAAAVRESEIVSELVRLNERLKHWHAQDDGQFHSSLGETRVKFCQLIYFMQCSTDILEYFFDQSCLVEMFFFYYLNQAGSNFA